ncbi:DEAD/DEAH box helicase [Magnetococcales bacterium HHB-1]
MILRPRQKKFVNRSVEALRKHKNTLAVAVTGFGKTISLSAVTKELLKDNDAKACVLAHRDELTNQNSSKFAHLNPEISTSIFDAKQKSWDGRTTFAMVQTLCREANLKSMPTLDLLVIDEAHHAVADSYLRIIDHTRELNDQSMIYGVTATPGRGDKKGLRPVFSNVADQVTLTETIQAGHLVPPRTFVLDVGVREQLKDVKRHASDFDMNEVAEIMDKSPVNEAVVNHWKEKARDRKTIIFCSTVEHARNVKDTFLAHNIKATMIHGEMSKDERKKELASFEEGNTQVVTNIAVLTEGYDFTPTSCIVLLRPSSYKSTMIQMVGRGLRTVDPNEFPGVVKTDCIVLDFGISSLMHGTLEQDVNLDGEETGEAPTKFCPECVAEVPSAVMECPICGYIWEPKERDGEDREEITDFIMSEVDLLKRSSFRWCDLFGDDAAMVANGFNAWGGVFFLNGRWHAVGGARRQRARLLSIGERTITLAAADDWLNENETDESAHKTSRWLNQPPTEKQLQYLPPECRNDFNLTRYQASALLTFQFNKERIKSLVFGAAA